MRGSGSRTSARESRSTVSVLRPCRRRITPSSAVLFRRPLRNWPATFTALGSPVTYGPLQCGSVYWYQRLWTVSGLMLGGSAICLSDDHPMRVSPLEERFRQRVFHQRSAWAKRAGEHSTSTHRRDRHGALCSAVHGTRSGPENIRRRYSPDTYGSRILFRTPPDSVRDQTSWDAPQVVGPMVVGLTPRNEVEQWSAALFPGHAAAHCCAGAARPLSTHLPLGSHQSAAHPTPCSVAHASVR
jgi:hypothetical protein